MLAIKLRPVGRKKQRTFRVVVQKKRSKLNGRYVEDLGHYDPNADKAQINQPRAEYWIEVGAQPTDTVYNLFVTNGIIEGEKRAVHAKSKKQEEESTEQSASPEKASTSDADKEESEPQQEQEPDDGESAPEEPKEEDSESDDEGGEEKAE